GSLAALKTPGLMSFLHMAFASLSFWISSYYDVFDTRAVAANPVLALRGCSIRATLFGLQMLTMYGSLLHSSVNMVLAWTSAAPLVIDVGLALVAHKRSRLLLPQLIPLVAAAAAATVFGIMLDRTKSWLSFAMLLLWSATKAVETGWRLLKEDPSLGGRLPGGDFGPAAAVVRLVADSEGGLNPATMALLVNALPALPVLLVGFMGQEGSAIEKTPGATLGTALCAVAAVSASAGASLQRHGSGPQGRQLRPFEGLASMGVAAGSGGAIDDTDDSDAGEA
ncbi:hypothetical protein TSOC_009325, partial [Tetrabaena socialis]